VNQTSYCPECHEAFEVAAERVGRDVINCPRCGTDVPVFNVATWVPEAASSDGQLLPSDVEIAGYEIRQQLGRGGMGVVFEGCQVSLGRRVAIKFLMPSLAANPHFVERFEREAAALAKLSHPNIVTIFERGRTPQGVYFIMEFVEGPGGSAPLDLRARLNERRLTAAEVKQYSLQVVQALAYAHHQGIVHRDIKPGNVMLDRHGNVKVADFGIASMASQREGIQLTAPSSPLGTLDYMAPEQRDNDKHVDQRADVYSVGVMLYEMLTGELPRGAYPPPSRIRPELDAGWDKIIESTLQPRPENRLGDMEELARQIEEIPTKSAPSGRVDLPTKYQQQGNEPQADASGGVFCADCGVGVSRESQFCPSCRAEQWNQCLGCQRRIHASLRYCPACGGDIQGFRMVQKYHETARRAMTLAQDKNLTVPERCDHAQHAGLAASRAMKYSPDYAKSKEILTEANEFLVALARRASHDAYRNRRLGEARSFLEQILQVQPDHKECAARLNEIQKYFLDSKSKATQFLAEGFPGKAASVLETLLTAFPGDAELTTRLEECRRNREEVTGVVQSVIPSLVAQNKWWAVRREINELEKSGVRVRRLLDYAVAVDTKLAEIAPGIRKAEKCLASGKFREAIECAEQILSRVADHPRALEMLASARTSEFEAKELGLKMKAASSNCEWFLASAMFAAVGPAVDELGLRGLEGMLRKGCREANNYARFVIWTFLGANLMAIGTKLTELLMTGIEDLLPDSDTGSILWRTSTLRTVGSLTFAILIGVGILAMLRAILRRPAPPGKVGVWSAIVLTAAAFFLISHLELIDIGKFTWIIPMAGVISIGLGAGLVGAVATRDLIDPPPIRLAPAALAGAGGVLVVQFSAMFQDDYARFLMPAAWLASLLLITRIISRWLPASLIVLAGLAASVLAVGIQRQYGDSSDVFLALATAILLAAVSIVAASDRRLQQVTIVTVFSFGVLAIDMMLPAFRSALTLWWVVAASVAMQVHDDLDPSLHIFDRLNSRRFRRTTSPHNNVRYKDISP